MRFLTKPSKPIITAQTAVVGDAETTAFWQNVLAEDLASRAEALSCFVDVLFRRQPENLSNTQELENIGISADTGDWFLLM